MMISCCLCRLRLRMSLSLCLLLRELLLLLLLAIRSGRRSSRDGRMLIVVRVGWYA